MVIFRRGYTLTSEKKTGYHPERKDEGEEIDLFITGHCYSSISLQTKLTNDANDRSKKRDTFV